MTAIALIVGVLAVTTGTDTKLRAYNIPLLPLPLATDDASAPKTSDVPTQVPELSPTGVIQSQPLSCRSDCTFSACPTGFSCMAEANDEGQFKYTCLNPKCSATSQNNQCECISPTPSIQ